MFVISFFQRLSYISLIVPTNSHIVLTLLLTGEKVINLVEKLLKLSNDCNMKYESVEFRLLP